MLNLIKFSKIKDFWTTLRIKRRLIALLAKWHFFGNPSKKIKIIGVTGTNGKTTIATLLYKISTELGYKSGLISTVNNIIGPENNIVPHDEKSPGTTPDPIYLNKLLSKMVKEGCEYAFMEVSSHSLDQKRVAGIKFTGGIFTNLTHDHLDYHKDFKNYFLAKKKFFEMLPKEAFALSNMDDERGIAMVENIKARKFLYGYSNKYANPQAKDIKKDSTPWEYFDGEILKSDFSGLELKINGEKVKSKLLGSFNAQNLLAVWGASKLIGFDMDKVKEILEKINPPKGRFDHFMSPEGVLIIVDYAHTPDALKNVLSTVNDIKQEGSRVISVFGCGGDRDPKKRPIMGKIGAQMSDIALFTSDNPRKENPDEIINEMKSDLSHDETKKVITISNRGLAIKEAMEMAKKGDIILCAGKGHEDYQEINGIRNHFDDIEEFKKTF